MANDISGNPWSLDTMGTIATFPVYIKNISWQPENNQAFTGAENLVILDNQGRVIINTSSNTTNDVMDFGALQWVQGFRVIQIDLGVVIVTVHK